MMLRTGLSLAFTLTLFLFSGCAETETDRAGDNTGPGATGTPDPANPRQQRENMTTPGTNNPTSPGQSADSDPTPNTNESPNGAGTGAQGGNNSGTGAQGGNDANQGGTNPGGANTQNR